MISRLHIKRCYDRRSSGQLLDDVRDLLDTGMLTLDPTLLTLPDERLIPKLVDVWGFLFGNILPYFEAVFLPLQQEFKGTGTLSAKESTEFFGLLPHFDVRRLVLVSFRDNVILPLHARLRSTSPSELETWGKDERKRVLIGDILCSTVLKTSTRLFSLTERHHA